MNIGAVSIRESTQIIALFFLSADYADYFVYNLREAASSEDIGSVTAQYTPSFRRGLPKSSARDGKTIGLWTITMGGVFKYVSNRKGL